MILSAIKQYFSENQIVSTTQLCQHFALTQSSLQPMLAHWERKGFIKPYEKCGGCQFNCHSASSPLISWYQVSESS